jgi:hypothetical protein
MNKETNTVTQRRIFVLLAGLGIVLGLGVSAFLASINGSDKSLAADAPRQTIEVQTPNQVDTTPEVTEEAITPAPNQESDGATVKVTVSPTPKPTSKPTQTVVDSSTRVKVTPKPVATPTQGSQTTTPVTSTPAAPAEKSPTEGYIRPQVSFIGVTSCSKTNDGWLLTASWKVSGGNYKGLWYGQRSGLKNPGDTWVISTQDEVVGSTTPTGEYSFWTEGKILEMLTMHGRDDTIDTIRFPEHSNADIKGLCR